LEKEYAPGIDGIFDVYLGEEIDVDVYSKGIEKLTEIDRQVMETLDAVIDAAAASIPGDSNVNFDSSDSEGSTDAIISGSAGLLTFGAESPKDVVATGERTRESGQTQAPSDLKSHARMRHLPRITDLHPEEKSEARTKKKDRDD
jgi:hypothetical protein